MIGRIIYFVAVIALFQPGEARARQEGPPLVSSAALLDVPYISQTEQLCGGAAVAMVLRYWGQRDVFPQDFAALADRTAGGISTGALVDDVTRRGWVAVSSPGGDDAILAWAATAIGRGQPVIALIEDRPGVFHYVVIAGVTPADVVIHDPARGPYRAVSRAEFDRQWAAARHWAMLILRGTTSTTVPATVREERDAEPDSLIGPDACAELIATNVAAARGGRLSEAERGLLAAIALCPGSSSAWLELAGLRFVQKRYGETTLLLDEALRLAPDETAAWQLMATSRYLQGDSLGALEAWNRIGEPRADTVEVEGLERTYDPVVVKLTGLTPRQLLTPEAFARASRRLSELPVAAATSLTYRPLSDGTAAVQAVVYEHDVVQTGIVGWASKGIDAVFRHEVRLSVFGPNGLGEVWDARYRWAANRPRVRFGFAAPSPGALPGIISVDALWERQSYASNTPEPPLREERTRVGVDLSDWVSGWLRLQAGGALDRFANDTYLALGGAVDTRWAGDRIATKLSFGYWAPAGSRDGFTTLGAAAAWRISAREPYTGWTAQAGFAAIGAAAPLALWPVAGASESRGVLLRGHTLFTDGFIVSEVFGRQLAYATIEYQRAIYRHRYGTLGVAGFSDFGRAWQRRDGAPPSPLHVDVGGGARISMPGNPGQLRFDIGFGLRDQQRKFSAGYVLPWGR